MTEQPFSIESQQKEPIKLTDIIPVIAEKYIKTPWHIVDDEQTVYKPADAIKATLSDLVAKGSTDAHIFTDLVTDPDSSIVPHTLVGKFPWMENIYDWGDTRIVKDPSLFPEITIAVLEKELQKGTPYAGNGELHNQYMETVGKRVVIEAELKVKRKEKSWATRVKPPLS